MSFAYGLIFPPIKTLSRMGKNKMPIFILYHDNKFIMEGTEFEMMRYIHNKHGYSFSWAISFQGYSYKRKE